MTRHKIIVGHETVAVDSIRHYHQNPRIGDVDKIKESLTLNGQYRDLIVDEGTREVLAGNHTLKAMVALGWEEAEVTWIRPIDAAHALRIVLVDNRSQDDASYNDILLAAILGELREEDEALLEGTGYSTDEVDELLADVVLAGFDHEEDEDPEEVSQVSALLNRLMPTMDQPSLSDEDHDALIASADRAAKMRDQKKPAPVEVFILFQFGELRAKVSKAAYDVFVAEWLQAHGHDLSDSGQAAAIKLGLPEDAVFRAVADGTERWL